MPLSKIPKSARAVVRSPARPDPRRMQSSPHTPAASVPGGPESTTEILALQQSLGNRAVQRLLASRSFQAKLQVGPADGIYDQEADKVAGQALKGAPIAEAGPALDQTGASVAQPKAGPASTSGGVEAGSGVERQVNSSEGSGGALPESTRTFMESRFGADFGGVRVHTGSDAARLNRAVQSDAFTHGQDIYFNAGKFEPGSQAGQQLLAHELTHVVQQGSAGQVRRKAALQVPANRPSTKK